MSRSDSPLPPATFFILFALMDGDKHGYAIMKQARELSGNRVKPGPATLYTTIQRLLDSGSIREVSPDCSRDSSKDTRRRYYSLTLSGRAAVEAELRQMEAILKKSKAMRLRSVEVPS